MTIGPAFAPGDLAERLRAVGLGPGDTVMVHASLRALEPGRRGAAAVARALLDAVSSGGTLMAYVSWDRSSYDETVGGQTPASAAHTVWPPFDAETALPYPGFGALNQFLLRLPSARRSTHPDDSTMAVGARAAALIEPHPLGSGYRPGSPIERFVEARGKILLLGAPLDSVTALRCAEALADVSGKRMGALRGSRERPRRRRALGPRLWVPVENSTPTAPSTPSLRPASTQSRRSPRMAWQWGSTPRPGSAARCAGPSTPPISWRSGSGGSRSASVVQRGRGRGGKGRGEACATAIQSTEGLRSFRGRSRRRRMTNSTEER